jgi:hypothetical protein
MGTPLNENDVDARNELATDSAEGDAMGLAPFAYPMGNPCYDSAGIGESA